MDNKFEERYKKAEARAKRSDKLEPRAESVSYDQKNGRIVVGLTNGTTFIFPPELAEGLAGASSKDLKQIQITPSGDGLRWGDLDVDLSLTGLLMGIFGGKRWMSELGRQGGKATTEVKIKAARTNGRKGGRPKRNAA
jgi:hypothetical protein